MQESLLLTVTDMQGKTIASQSLEGSVFVHSVAEYPNGVYLMRITTLDGAVIETAKIVVGGR
ncbi:MAG: T9SS type A sorting domain-containing protein [Bacteroidetes bacterium]|nr:T9SS type A sorting domain-containing protein [Bacteroidota bacterium]